MVAKATAPLPPGAGESAFAPRLKALLSQVGGDAPGEGGDDVRRRPAGEAAADADTGARCSRSGISGPGGVN